MSFDGVASGWTVWSEERDRSVLVYRPDVFDTDDFPAPCLPTLYVTKGRRGRRPGRDVPDPEDPWYVTLFLEPEVTGRESQFESREAAIEGAIEIAREFQTGAVDYRAAYQVPRDAYLDRLDELTGHD